MKNLLSGSIRTKLIGLFLAISLIPVLTIGAISYMSSKAILTKQIEQDFDAISQGKEQAVAQYLMGANRALNVYEHDKTIIDALKDIKSNSANAPAAIKVLQSYIDERLRLHPLVQEFIIMDNSGMVVACTEPKEIGKDKSQDPYFTGAKEHGFFIKDVYQSLVSGKIGFVSSVPVSDVNTKEFLGVFGERINLQMLNEIVSDRTGQGETGENYLVNREGLMITESRFEKDVILKRRIESEPVKFFQTNGRNFRGVYRDYRGAITLGSTSGELLKKTFPYLGWIVLSEIDAKEAFNPIAKLGFIITIVIIITAAIITLAGIIVANRVANPIKDLSRVAGTVATGDLTVSAEAKGRDEIGQLADSFNYMLKNLNGILSKTKDAVGRISSASSEILAASQQQAAGAREQSAAVSETTSASKELSKSAEQVGENIKRVSESTVRTIAGMIKIKDSISKTNQIIASLSEKSQKIGKIAEVIDDVADRTNLLAVNAAIEAARAGEEGRGFTVVADEIRKLADSTAKSTKDITALIEVIQHEMSNVAISMEDSVASVNEESGRAQESAEISKEIAMSTAQQISGSKQIAEAMANIDEVMKQIATGAQQSQTAVKQLSDTGKELKELAEKFRIAKA